MLPQVEFLPFEKEILQKNLPKFFFDKLSSLIKSDGVQELTETVAQVSQYEARSSLAKGTILNHEESHETLVMLAGKKGNPAVMECLVNAGANLNKRCSWEWEERDGRYGVTRSETNATLEYVLDSKAEEEKLLKMIELLLFHNYRYFEESHAAKGNLSPQVKKFLELCYQKCLASRALKLKPSPQNNIILGECLVFFITTRLQSKQPFIIRHATDMTEWLLEEIRQTKYFGVFLEAQKVSLLDCVVDFSASPESDGLRSQLITQITAIAPLTQLVRAKIYKAFMQMKESKVQMEQKSEASLQYQALSFRKVDLIDLAFALTLNLTGFFKFGESHFAKVKERASFLGGFLNLVAKGQGDDAVYFLQLHLEKDETKRNDPEGIELLCELLAGKGKPLKVALQELAAAKNELASSWVALYKFESDFIRREFFNEKIWGEKKWPDYVKLFADFLKPDELGGCNEKSDRKTLSGERDSSWPKVGSSSSLTSDMLGSSATFLMASASESESARSPALAPSLSGNLPNR